ncbi:MAG TPA: Hsp20/alpha crystallin family protein [Phycisphaerae bacterium]|nr:Hsp20/alpha crystallin family protein [Phycisphaerales bacterium]HRX83422.1 Hsp20/alpha crystallin family protein [Phycisphaerae bacterium]
MLTTRFNRWNTMNGFRNEVDRLFTDIFGDAPAGALASRVGTFPALNIWEDAEHIRIEAELPGLQLADIEVVVDENDLTIKGSRKAPETEGVSFHRRERGVGTFSRTVRLPVAIDAEKVEATLNSGVLQVTLPKAPEARPRKIEVKAAQ